MRVAKVAIKSFNQRLNLELRKAEVDKQVQSHVKDAHPIEANDTNSSIVTYYFITPTMTIALPRQGTCLTRPDPRPQIESTLYWVPD